MSNTYRIILLCMVIVLLIAASSDANDQTAGSDLRKSLREKLSLDQGWRFHLGDIPLDSFPGGQGIALYGPDFAYNGAKAGHAWGAAARGYGDHGHPDAQTRWRGPLQPNESSQETEPVSDRCHDESHIT